jgi:hypothetical protein
LKPKKIFSSENLMIFKSKKRPPGKSPGTNIGRSKT